MKSWVLDEIDEKILDLLKGNARMSYQELGDAIGMSRVAAKKRVMKLEQEGIIRGYNTYIFREDSFFNLQIPVDRREHSEMIGAPIPIQRRAYSA